MLKKISQFFSFLKERLGEKGQGMVEYALILAAVALIAVVAIWGTGKGGTDKDLQTAVTGAFTKAATAVDNAQNRPTQNSTEEQ